MLWKALWLLLDFDSSESTNVFEPIDKLFLARADVSELMESYSGLSILITIVELLQKHAYSNY